MVLLMREVALLMRGGGPDDRRGDGPAQLIRRR